MKNKHVGMLIIGLAVIIGLIVFLFNNALTTIVNTSCSHGTSCPMYGTIHTQTYIGIALIAIIVVIGLVLIFSKEEKQFVIKKIKEKSKSEEKKKEVNLSLLDKEEKVIVNLIQESKGTIFQSDLVEKSGFDKVKVTRILDKLEGRQVIQRMRRGMTNVVMLK
jgi:DNA-binding MarR family transcriptional regulator